MKVALRILTTVAMLIGLIGLVPLVSAQCFSSSEDPSQVPAVSGYEQALAARIRAEIQPLSPTTDNLGNVYVTLGSGAPHRLIVTPIDEPGYIVSNITPDGFLRVQRLPQAPPTPVFDLLHATQPVWVMTRTGQRINGVFAGLSVHLQPLRQNPPKMNHPDDMFVDIGAENADEVKAAGVDVLDPIALQRESFIVGDSGRAGPAAGDHFGCEALLQLLRRVKDAHAKGTIIVAFVTQQLTGGRGLDRLLEETNPDEMIFVGRLASGPAAESKSGAQTAKPGAGVLLGVANPPEPLKGFASELKAIAEKDGVPMIIVNAAPPRIVSYAKTRELPERFAELGVPLLWPVTPGEFLSFSDAEKLERILEAYLDVPKPTAAGGIAGSRAGSGVSAFQALVETHGASGHEENVRKVVLNRLDSRLQKKVETDAAGNLILHLGDAKPGAKTPKIAFVAHMDEIGYQVKSIELDGRVSAEVLGGGYSEYFLGHVVLVHSANNLTIGGVLELPAGWDKPGFEWPHGPRMLDEPAHVYVGTQSSAATEKLGIKPGDWITIPKKYRPLLGTRANGRSFDDRVGCAALIEAANALGPDLPGRDVTFIWSTEEEVGLNGAAAAAERLAKEGKVPDFVFAIDTFVSADSPLESKRFADAEIGKGFVIRAVDNSNITPPEHVARVIQLARDNNVPVQYGVTGGGNDGAVFTRYGSVDIPLGWPLRYSHSPGEVIDTRDLDSLAKIITALSKNW